MPRRRIGAVVFLASAGLVWLGTQIVSQSHGGDPSGKLFLAGWLESQLWVNPWLISVGAVGVVVGVLLFSDIAGASIARLAVLLIGLEALAWGTILPARLCTWPSFDYGYCSDETALKSALVIVGGTFIGGSVGSYVVARRRAASPA